MSARASLVGREGPEPVGGSTLAIKVILPIILSVFLRFHSIDVHNCKITILN